MHIHINFTAVAWTRMLDRLPRLRGEALFCPVGVSRRGEVVELIAREVRTERREDRHEPALHIVPSASAGTD